MPTPAGKPLDEGIVCRITHAGFPNIELFQVEVTPIGFEGGGAINTTTQQSVKVRTQAPKKLYSVSNSTLKCAFDPVLLNSIKSARGVKGQITHDYPDGSKWQYYGWFESFKFDAIKEGSRPECTVVIEAANTDGAGAESEPTYTAPP